MYSLERDAGMTIDYKCDDEKIAVEVGQHLGIIA
jgi:hypothetical protein